MARPLRIQYPGALYHVTNRGNEKKAIFKDDVDRVAFLEILSRSIVTYDIRLYSFVLMTNHFHFLLETPFGNLGEFMRHFNITYTSHYNRRHKRSGHLYQGRYKSFLIDKDDYLSVISRYMHLNPVKVGTVRKKPVQDQLEYLWAYKWSSLPGYVSIVKRHKFVEYGIVLEEYGGDNRGGRLRYKKQIAADLAAGLSIKEQIIGQSILGDDDFAAWVKERHLPGSRDRERPAVGRISSYVSVDEILSAIAQATSKSKEEILGRPGETRQLAMEVLYRYGGLKNREIGSLMGIDYSTVSIGRKRIRKKARGKSSLSNLMKEVEEKISRIKI
jgi:putative transposase